MKSRKARPPSDTHMAHTVSDFAALGVLRGKVESKPTFLPAGKTDRTELLGENFWGEYPKLLPQDKSGRRKGKSALHRICATKPILTGFRVL